MQKEKKTQKSKKKQNHTQQLTWSKGRVQFSDRRNRWIGKKQKWTPKCCKSIVVLTFFSRPTGRREMKTWYCALSQATLLGKRTPHVDHVRHVTAFRGPLSNPETADPISRLPHRTLVRLQHSFAEFLFAPVPAPIEMTKKKRKKQKLHLDVLRSPSLSEGKTQSVVFKYTRQLVQSRWYTNFLYYLNCRVSLDVCDLEQSRSIVISAITYFTRP